MQLMQNNECGLKTWIDWSVACDLQLKKPIDNNHVLHFIRHEQEVIEHWIICTLVEH